MKSRGMTSSRNEPDQNDQHEKLHKKSFTSSFGSHFSKMDLKWAIHGSTLKYPILIIT